MSKQLLYHLNGPTSGRFKAYLDSLKDAPRIAWYPSAGTDFRALLYLHPDFARKEPAATPDPAPPDIFLFTDYFPWSSSKFLDGHLVHVDPRTTIRLAALALSRQWKNSPGVCAWRIDISHDCARRRCALIRACRSLSAIFRNQARTSR